MGGVKGSATHTRDRKVDAIIYDGFPEQDYFYLYTLNSDGFENKPSGSCQWVSLKPVKPVRMERLSVKDHIHLVRKASKKEREKWFSKFSSKLKVS